MPVADRASALRILLVEDEAPNRALLRAVLGRARRPTIQGATLLEATTLAEARRHLAGQPIDVVLLDVRLPDGNGLDLAREIRTLPNARRPRVLVLSASVLPMDRSAAVEAGADGFLPKPFDTAELLDVVATLVDDRGGAGPE